MKVHPALFEREGRGATKIEEHFSQLTKQYYFTQWRSKVFGGPCAELWQVGPMNSLEPPI